MLLKFYEDKRCVSAIDLLLGRNLYELGYPEPYPNVSVSFTPQQRKAASSLLIFHRRNQTGAEWKSFQYAVLNGKNRTPIITTVYQAKLVAEKVLNEGQTVGCCSMHAYVQARTCHGVPLAGTFARFWSVWGSHLAAWLPAGDEGQAGVGAAPAEAPGPAVTEQQQQPPQPSSSSHGHAEAGCSWRSATSPTPRSAPSTWMRSGAMATTCSRPSCLLAMGPSLWSWPGRPQHCTAPSPPTNAQPHCMQSVSVFSLPPWWATSLATQSRGHASR